MSKRRPYVRPMAGWWRKNPFFVFTEETSNQVQLKQASLFPIIPFISYNIKF